MRFKPFRYINAMILHFLISKVRKHYIKIVKKIQKWSKIREIKRITKIRWLKEAINENKINPVIKKSSGFKVIDNYYIIY